MFSMDHQSFKMVDNLRFVFGLYIILFVNLHGANSAKYVGRSAEDAGVYLDNSQNKECEKCLSLGHPRGHASFPDATGPTDSVENYSNSTQSKKTGFLSRDDQNLVTHIALSHNKSQDVMALMNEGNYNGDVILLSEDFPPDTLPQMKEYLNGIPSTESFNITKVVLILKHYVGKYMDKTADVFIYTMYPKYY